LIDFLQPNPFIINFLKINYMQKTLFLLLLMLWSGHSAMAQNEAPVVSTKKLKVVFQLTSGDTLAQKALAKQLYNFLTAAPNAKIEVVCHNNGISFLQSAVSKQGDKIKELSARGVDFVACENTLRERKIKREELLKECRTVPAGVVEVVLKQDKGWSYIKAGL
jgi:intracellular sulfur oxidation DsrE/DsrF family protein